MRIKSAFKTAILFMLIGAMSLGVCSCKNEQKEFITASEAVAEIGIGWNIGNTLDASGSIAEGADIKAYETSWGNPAVTKELIQAVKAAGFNAIRLPVTYKEKMSDDGTIDSKWLDRVEEVVDMILKEDMYCIINLHHDTGGSEHAWLRADREMFENGMAEKFVYVWEQIADRFKNHGEKLMFESFNEILDSYFNWTQATKEESYDVINELNQLFVDTVRASGGYNDQRNIIVLPYGASSALQQIKHLVPPTDTAQKHLIIEFHCYEPGEFVGGDDEYWREQYAATIDRVFERIDTYIIEPYGLPVIIGEFGAHEQEFSMLYQEARSQYAEYFTKCAAERGIKCFWWDEGGSMKLFDRKKNEVYRQNIIDAMLKGVTG